MPDDDFTIIERSSGVGGTWHDNRYPGAGCDVPSHLYCFSFAPKPDWQHKFARQPEIDGGLIGGASLDPDSFIEMVRIAARRD